MTALRRLLRAPLYAATMALCMALVVLFNGSALAGLWALLWQPLPYADPSRLVQLRIDLKDIDFQVGLSPSLLAAVRSRPEFASAVGSPPVKAALDGSGRVWRTQRVSEDFHRVTGVAPALGAALEAQPVASAEPALLLSDAAWRTHFAGAPEVLGQRWRIGEVDYRIAGVMPAGFSWPDTSVQGWTTYAATADERATDAAGGFGQFEVSARLAPGVTVADAQGALAAVFAGSDNAFLRNPEGPARADVRPWREQFSAGHLQPLLLVQASALLLLLMAATHLAGLSLDRALARQGDHAVLRALGALPRQLRAMSTFDLVLPALCGAAIGAALVPAGLATLGMRGLLPEALPVAPGGGAIGPALGLAAGLATLLVAWALLRFGQRQIGSGRPAPGARTVSGLSRAQVLMLGAQLALTVALAGGAALLLQSAANLAGEMRGFDADGVLLTQVDFSDPARTAQMETLREAIAALPGVSGVARASMPPFGGAEFIAEVTSARDDAPAQARLAMVSPGYFDVLRVPLLAGRAFTAADGADAVVVDATYARRFGRPASAIGQWLRSEGEETAWRIVGVAAAVKQKALDEDAGGGMLYRPLTDDVRSQFLVTRGVQSAPVEAVRKLLAQRAPDAEIMLNLTLAEAVARTHVVRRALMETVTLFALGTLLLSALGVYTALSTAVRRRIPEFGLRVALGAAPLLILREVYARSARILLPGMLLGLGIGYALARLLADRLHRVAPDDGLSWTLALAAVGLIGLLAVLPPGLRALRAPPAASLLSNAERRP